MYIYKIYHRYASSFAINHQCFFSETWSILSKFSFNFFLVFSKNNAGTKKQLAQNEEFQMADITRGTPFFIRSKGESAIPFNRQTAEG